MNPVEQLFSYIREKLKEVVPEYANNCHWDKENMKGEIIKALREVDIDLIRLFYRASFMQTFPTYKVLSYLKDLPKKTMHS